MTRRAARARGLLTAASAATLLAVVLLTALSMYGGQAIESATRAAVAAVPAEERSILVSGSVREFSDAASLDDVVTRATRREFAGAAVARAGYAVGQQLPSRLGDAQPGEDGPLLASVMFLEDLPRHADLVSGAWPAGGGSVIETALAEPAATLLGVTVGDEIPLADRRADKTRTLRVAGVWKPRDLADPYWRLAPETRSGAMVGGATYGPLTVDRDDFARHFGELASLSWLVAPDLSAATGTELRDARRSVDALSAGLRERSDGRLDSTARIDELTERLARSTAVARSTLLAPALLLTLIAGHALLLVARLLAEQRRAENALIRARGAGSRQLAGLAVAEAALAVAPALLLGPPLAAALLWLAVRTPWFDRLGLRVEIALTPGAWLVAGVAALACGLALVAPSLRRGATYVSEQQARSRPARRAALQRAGIDVALVALAVLAWAQLRQYGSPLLGLDVDPVLVAAPTLAVLAATAAGLRLLPWITRAAQQAASSRRSFAALLGAWQAGRRPHAGTVLLISLAVGVATLALCLEGTAQRSLLDQASHRAGADLRLVEIGPAPAERAGALAAIPGVSTVLPAVRGTTTVGASATADVLMTDATRAARVMRPREDLTDRPARQAFGRLGESRIAGLETALPRPSAGSRPARLTGQIVLGAAGRAPHVDLVRVWADVRDRRGVMHSVLVREGLPDGSLTRIDLALPAGAAALYGFRVDATLARDADLALTLSVQNLATADAAGRSAPVELADRWRVAHTTAELPLSAGTSAVTAKADGLDITHRAAVDPAWSGWSPFARPLPFRFGVLRPVEAPDRIGALVTPRVLEEIGGRVGSGFAVQVPGGELDAEVVGVIDAVPGVANERAVMIDLAAVTLAAYPRFGAMPRPTEWRLATRPDQHQAAARRIASFADVETFDRRSVTPDPLGEGARLVLLPAALAVALLAGLGIAVDARATARSRASELAVLHTMGSPPRMLARALVVEQAVLAGLGVAAGLVIGVAVAWTMGPLLVLTPDAARPVPTPVLIADPVLIGAPAAGLMLVALGLAAAAATASRRGLAALGER
ncbi:MAG: FtsX-like permease family protein [Micromonosporaceae bacterium]|nr:FtsX-like permease family protein [Micromonosporaceae bacterium]